MQIKTNGPNTWETVFRDRNITFLPTWLRDLYFTIITPAVRWVIKTELHPNIFTALGLALSVVAAIVLGAGYFFWGGLFILLSGCCDVFDGMIARARSLGSKFGALFDSTLDRYSEFSVFLGISYYFVRADMVKTAVVAFLALGGSLMVSYVRARAEGLGLQCKIGIMQRPERIVYLGFGAMAGEIPFIVVLYVIAILANFTAIQRVFHVWKSTFESEPSLKTTIQKEEIPQYNSPTNVNK